MLAETYASWLHSVSQCCPPLASHDEKHRPSESGSWGHQLESPSEWLSGRPRIRTLTGADVAKSGRIYRDQPAPEPPPSAEQLWPSERGYFQERAARKRSMSGGSRFSVRRRFMSNASSRRPQISAPTNFRHLYSESFQFPSPQPRQRPVSFRPIELSIYAPNNQLSPLLPHFDINDHVHPPPAAHTRAEGSWDDSSVTLTHERSYSSMSFHLPRRQVHEASSFSESQESSPPRIPARSRARAYTAPSVERIVERIASAMLERERLQSEIDSIVERQSIYTNSRPTTAYGMQGMDNSPGHAQFSRLIQLDLEPMPSIPALPAAAPSFAERLSQDGFTESRPQTAPPSQQQQQQQTIHIPRREKSFAEASARFNNYRPMREGDLDRPLAPPLPLVLRPPLRKKKSFSRVSSWLFPDGGQARHHDMSLDSVTNLPRPTREGDGYYQTATPVQRTSLDTVTTTTASSWETDDEAEEEEKSQTVPTATWSPGSSPLVGQESGVATPTKTRAAPPTSMMRTATFGRGARAGSGVGAGAGHRPQSVGVAF